MPWPREAQRRCHPAHRRGTPHPAVARIWKQVRVTATPGTTRAKQQVARDAEGGIRFQGEVVTPRGPVLDRTTLSPLPDGSVRRIIEVSRDGGRTWTATFDARYVRRAR